jgi:hypothetical protein
MAMTKVIGVIRRILLTLEKWIGLLQERLKLFVSFAPPSKRRRCAAPGAAWLGQLSNSHWAELAGFSDCAGEIRRAC